MMGGGCFWSRDRLQLQMKQQQPRELKTKMGIQIANLQGELRYLQERLDAIEKQFKPPNQQLNTKQATLAQMSQTNANETAMIKRELAQKKRQIELLKDQAQNLQFELSNLNFTRMIDFPFPPERQRVQKTCIKREKKPDLADKQESLPQNPIYHKKRVSKINQNRASKPNQRSSTSKKALQRYRYLQDNLYSKESPNQIKINPSKRFQAQPQFFRFQKTNKSKKVSQQKALSLKTTDTQRIGSSFQPIIVKRKKERSDFGNLQR